MRGLRQDIAELFFEMQFWNPQVRNIEAQSRQTRLVKREGNSGNHRKAKPIPFYLTPKAYEALLNRKTD